MNRIISITIGGMVFPIEENAYQHLNEYLEKLKRHFDAGGDGGEEILIDIEARIAEMLDQDPGKGNSVTLKRIEEIITVMGTPSDFGIDEEESRHREYTRRGARKLYRNPDDRIAGGVCSGIAAYFSIDALWVRILFIFSFLTFGTGIILYVILWAIIPEAQTTAEKLEMRGEKVTIDNIEKSVREEFDRLKKNFNDADLGGKASRSVRNAGSAAQNAVRQILIFSGRVVGAALLLGGLGFLVVSGLIYFGILVDVMPSPIFPYFNMLFESYSLALVFQLCVIAATIIPLIGIMLLGIRLLFRYPKPNRWFLAGSLALWVVSISGLIGMGLYLERGWKDESTLSRNIEIPTSDTLYISSSNEHLVDSIFFSLNFGRARGTRGIYGKQGGEIMRPIALNIQPVRANKIRLEEQKISRGRSYQEATQLAGEIITNNKFEGNVLQFNPYLRVKEDGLWRNQRVEYDLQVPVGTVIVFEENTSTFLNNISTSSYISNRRLEGRSLKMGANGLLINEGEESPSGEVQQAFSYNDFKKVEINGISKVHLYSSETYRVDLMQGSEEVPLIHNEDGKLIVKVQPYQITDYIEVSIGLPDLKYLEINGATETKLHIKQAGNLAIELNGAVQVDGQVKASKLEIASSGMNQCRLNGKVHTLKAELEGSGRADLDELIAQDAIVEADGAAYIAIHAEQTLNAEANGASRVVYKGSPKLQRMERTGGSSIKPAKN